MGVSESGSADGGGRRVLGLALVGGTAAVVFVFGVLHTLHEPTDGVVGVVVSGVPFALAAVLGAGAVHLDRIGLPVDGVIRVGMWTVGGGLLGNLFGCLVVLHQRQEEGALVDPAYVVCVAAAAGATAGLLLGGYDARRVVTLGRLDAEREHSERLEQQLRVLNRVLRHDIRNDANVIRGYADLLAGAAPATDEAVVAIRARARNLVNTGENARHVEELIGTERLANERVDAAALARAEVDQVTAARPTVRVDTDIPVSAPVVGSRLLSTAIANVVENAVEHNDGTDPRVEVTVERTGGWVVVTVADNGPGVPDEERAVLERGSETPLHHSSGLGLWLVNWVVEDCGGRVHIRERDPSGSVVRLELRSAE